MDKFYYLMFECYEFLTYRFEVWGFYFSFFNITLFVAVFNTCINVINGLFGVDKHGNYD
jgi:hypothetical protein